MIAPTYHTVKVGETKVFYREAGPKDGPTLLMLHGFPSSSHQYRNVIPLIAESGIHVVAPDMPGFGSTESPKDFEYTFDKLADIMDGFTSAIGLDKFAMYIFDYGAPVGMRLATRHPESITGIISQNGNAYEEGLTEAWAPIRAYWNEETQENRDALRGLLTRETTTFQYYQGAMEDRKNMISPDAINHDQSILDRDPEIQLDLFRDYRTNVSLYLTWQEYFRTKKPRLLAVWGKNDPFFGPEGAKAFSRDLPGSKIELLDGGHFLLETHGKEVSDHVVKFMKSFV